MVLFIRGGGSRWIVDGLCYTGLCIQAEQSRLARLAFIPWLATAAVRELFSRRWLPVCSCSLEQLRSSIISYNYVHARYWSFRSRPSRNPGTDLCNSFMCSVMVALSMRPAHLHWLSDRAEYRHPRYSLRCSYQVTGVLILGIVSLYPSVLLSTKVQ